MATSCINNEYYSGQGSILLAEKSPTTGEPMGFIPVGNATALTLGIETSVFQHKESCSGTRGVDKEIVQEIAVNVAMTLESLNKENLALAMYGSSALGTAGTVTDEQTALYLDKWMPLKNIKVSSVIVGDDAVPTTTYTEGTDYVLNPETGSIKALTGGAITDGQVVFVDYSYDAYETIEAILSSAAPERWVRFEGLNTANDNKPVVVDIYRMSVKPLAELALINEELAQMVVEGAALSDPTRTTGSKYYTVRKIA